eukprot:scaffold167922_cov51-Prasinocladus_malaysianus.AAC.1
MQRWVDNKEQAGSVYAKTVKGPGGAPTYTRVVEHTDREVWALGLGPRFKACGGQPGVRDRPC